MRRHIQLKNAWRSSNAELGLISSSQCRSAAARDIARLAGVAEVEIIRYLADKKLFLRRYSSLLLDTGLLWRGEVMLVGEFQCDGRGVCGLLPCMEAFARR